MINDGAIKGTPSKPPVVNRNRVASTLWDDLCPQLVAAGILSKVDGLALANLCMAYSRLVRARGELDGTEPAVGPDGRLMFDESGRPKKQKKSWIVLAGTGGMKAHPMLQVEQVACNEIGRALDALGLNPTARARIQKLAEEKAKSGLDPDSLDDDEDED